MVGAAVVGDHRVEGARGGVGVELKEELLHVGRVLWLREEGSGYGPVRPRAGYRRRESPSNILEDILTIAMIVDRSIREFLDELASSAPTPGGGSAAALVGAVGAALLAMVGNLTAGKKGYEAVDRSMRDLVAESDRLRSELVRLADEDVRVFGEVMAAYRMPRGDDAERAARRAAIQRALLDATEAPLELARVCSEVIDLAATAAEEGNTNVVSDAGVGVVAAHAALRAAALNVWINAGSIDDRAFADRAVAELERLLAAGAERTEAVFTRVRERL